MRVLHVNNFYQRIGGAEVVLFNTLDALEASGVENVIAHGQPENTLSNSRRNYLLSDLIPESNPVSFKQAQPFLQVLKKERPDIVHIHQINNPKIAQLSCQYYPTIQSVYNHDFYCPGGGKYFSLQGKICERRFGLGCISSAFLTHCNSIRPTRLISSFNRCRTLLNGDQRNNFLAISNYQVARLVENGIPKKSIKLLPPFTQLPQLNGWRIEEPELPVLLYSGRITSHKGLDKLLSALLHVKSPHRLIIDGDGYGLNKVKQVAAELNLGDRVRFVGWSSPPEHQHYYQLASVVVVPSIWPEPFGMVGIEAMSYSKPVVAFNVGGIPEWLEDGVTGFLIPPYDTRKMANRIDYLLANPDIARKMGGAGRAVVENNFNSNTYVEKLLEIYEEIKGCPLQNGKTGT